jgi:hypothetical protein
MIEQHFARVEPVVGTSLRRARVAVHGLPAASPLVEHLAACGVGRWLWDAPCSELRRELLARHGDALGLELQIAPLVSLGQPLRSAPPDLVLAVGEREALVQALDCARSAGVPALLVETPGNVALCRALVALPGDDAEAAARWFRRFSSGGVDRWTWRTSAPLLAGLARALLLRGTPHARPDLEALWARGVRSVTLGGAHPFDVRWDSAEAPPRHLSTAPFETPEAPRGTLLVAGLGSLGSVAAATLVGSAHTFVLADPEPVDVYNPARQAYRRADIGRPKAAALREEVLRRGARRAFALEEALRDERRVGRIVERHGVTAAIVVTGTPADFPIARALRALDVPHVVGRCYPRARYWEAIVVDGLRGPALSDIRGHVTPLPAAPLTPEQRAAYSDAGVLEAEPATLIESGWAAAWMARLAAQLLAPPGLRERWLLELLAAGRTCVVGGVGVEETADGPAYAVALPGQIHAWGREQVRSPYSALP